MKAPIAHRWLGAILLLFLLVGVSYALATPPLESSDEYKHYPVVQHIVATGDLPVLDPENPGRWLQSAAQAPLYYVFMAGLTAGIDAGDLPEVHQVNPYVFIGDTRHDSNNNLIIHDPAREAFPWSGTMLAVYVIRFFSLLFGAGTVWLTFHLGRLLYDETTGLFAAALTAFNPMFLFTNSAVNNDALAAFMGVLGLTLLVRLWRDPPSMDEPTRGWARFAALGVVLGLGFLTKLSVGALLGLTGVALAVLAIRQRSRRLFFVGGLLIAGPALLLAAPMLLRNLQLYGDLTALNVFIAVQGVRETAITWSDWVAEFGTFYRTYWGAFGAVNIAAPDTFYAAANALALLGATGLVLRARPRAAAPVRDAWTGGRWLPAAWFLILFALLLRWNTLYIAFQGRLLFPGLGGINVLWAAGLLAWFGLPASGRWRGRLALGVTAAALLAAGLLPWTEIRPAYARPAPLAAVPEGAAFGPILFPTVAGELRLVGVEVAPEQRVVSDGPQPVGVTLYWETAAPVVHDYLSAVSLLGRDLTTVARINRYPAGGAVPTSHWLEGQIWRDRYELYVEGDPAAPALLRIRVGLYDPDDGVDVAARAPDGTVIDLLLVGEAVLESPSPAFGDVPVALDVVFADGVVLRGYGPAGSAARGAELPLDLYWEAAAPVTGDYTVFVQLLDGENGVLADADAPPLNGDYPTRLWRSGDRLIDPHPLAVPPDLPPGIYRIAVGLYDPVTGVRAPLADGDDAFTWPVEIGR